MPCYSLMAKSDVGCPCVWQTTVVALFLHLRAVFQAPACNATPVPLQGTFYNDQRHPEAQDHSAEIMDFCRRQRVTAPVKFLPLPAAQQALSGQPLLDRERCQAPSLILQPEERPAQSLPEVPSLAAGTEWCHSGSQGLLNDVPVPETVQLDPPQSGPDNAAPSMGPDSHSQLPSRTPGLQPSQSDFLTQPDAFSKQPSLASPSFCSEGSDQLDFNPCLDEPLPESPRALGQPACGPHIQLSEGLDGLAEGMVKDQPAAPGLISSQPMDHSRIFLGLEVNPAPAMSADDEYPVLEKACFAQPTSASFGPEVAAAAAKMSLDEMTGMLCEPDAEDEEVKNRAGSCSEPMGLACWSEHMLQQASDPSAADKHLAGPPGRR